MKMVDFENLPAEPMSETHIAKLEQRAAPLRPTKETERRRARQHRAKLARRITRRNTR